MDIERLGLIGAGHMGAMMALLFAELDIEVRFLDPSDANAGALLRMAREAQLGSRVHRHTDHEGLCKALGGPGRQPRAILLSLPQGQAVDRTIESLRPHLARGDIIMDASNELWTRTEARQRALAPGGVHYVGMGVSGGYQSARHGPSISPGGSKVALDLALPLLEKACARDRQGRLCVARIGPGGGGHFVKMIHNGIEQGMMAALAEVWVLMRESLGMSHDEIGDVFAAWSGDTEAGPLHHNFLIDIAADGCRKRDEHGGGGYVLDTIKDKVVQDVDATEGTGAWTVEDAARRHVPIPTIAAAHFFRCASAHAARRTAVSRAGRAPPSPSKAGSGDHLDKAALLPHLYNAVFASFLLTFVQGLQALAVADDQQGWQLSFRDVLQVWRGGCIIQSDGIVDILERVYTERAGSVDKENLLACQPLAASLVDRGAIGSLKTVLLEAVKADHSAPALAASLEYYKYSGGLGDKLPGAQFMEAQLDYFGAHMFDYEWEGPGEPVTGRHHVEWRPARGIHGT